MTSKDYWKGRALLLEQLLNTRAEATVQQIARLYGLAQENIFQQIERVFSAHVKGGALNEKKAMELLTVRETETARGELLEQYRRATGQVKRDLWARLSAPAYANRISRLQALRDSLYAQARMIGLEEVSYVRDRLSDTLEQAYYRTTFDIQQYTGEGYSFDLLDDNQIKAALAADWSGKNWSSRIWDNNQLFADAVQDTVTVGIMAGLRYDEMRDNLLHVIGMDETEGARYRSARLIKTECAYIANQGHLLGYQAANIDRYIFLATLDLRTSEVCRSLDMKRFPVAEAQAGTNLPPMHPHCRSTTMPDMSDEQLRRVNRAARDPVTGKSITVPGDMSYQQWYRKFVEGSAPKLQNGMMRRRGNAGAFSAFPERMTKKHIREVAKEIGVDLSDVTISIDATEDNINLLFSGMSDMKKGGTIVFEPPAFASREELARTIFHEKLHIDQYREFGYDYVTDNYLYFEQITSQAEDEFAEQMRKEGKF